MYKLIETFINSKLNPQNNLLCENFLLFHSKGLEDNGFQCNYYDLTNEIIGIIRQFTMDEFDYSFRSLINHYVFVNQLDSGKHFLMNLGVNPFGICPLNEDWNYQLLSEQGIFKYSEKKNWNHCGLYSYFEDEILFKSPSFSPYAIINNYLYGDRVYPQQMNRYERSGRPIWSCDLTFLGSVNASTSRTTVEEKPYKVYHVLGIHEEVLYVQMYPHKLVAISDRDGSFLWDLDYLQLVGQIPGWGGVPLIFDDIRGKAYFFLGNHFISIDLQSSKIINYLDFKKTPEVIGHPQFFNLMKGVKLMDGLIYFKQDPFHRDQRVTFGAFDPEIGNAVWIHYIPVDGDRNNLRSANLQVNQTHLCVADGKETLYLFEKDTNIHKDN